MAVDKKNKQALPEQGPQYRQVPVHTSLHASMSGYRRRACLVPEHDVSMSYTDAVSSNTVIIPVVGNILSVSQQMKYRTLAVSHV